jgi:hypothetical protein
MKNRKKLAKGVLTLSMALGFGIPILAPTHEAVASCGCKNRACVYTVPEPGGVIVACKIRVVCVTVHRTVSNFRIKEAVQLYM